MVRQESRTPNRGANVAPRSGALVQRPDDLAVFGGFLGLLAKDFRSQQRRSAGHQGDAHGPRRIARALLHARGGKDGDRSWRCRFRMRVVRVLADAAEALQTVAAIAVAPAGIVLALAGRVLAL